MKEKGGTCHVYLALVSYLTLSCKLFSGLHTILYQYMSRISLGDRKMNVQLVSCFVLIVFDISLSTQFL